MFKSFITVIGYLLAIGGSIGFLFLLVMFVTLGCKSLWRTIKVDFWQAAIEDITSLSRSLQAAISKTLLRGHIGKSGR